MYDTKLEEDTKLESDEVKYCSDFDEDCEDVVCKMACWLYDKETGICPLI